MAFPFANAKTKTGKPAARPISPGQKQFKVKSSRFKVNGNGNGNNCDQPGDPTPSSRRAVAETQCHVIEHPAARGGG